MVACMKKERQARRDANAIAAAKKQEEIRERIRNDKTDFEELLKFYASKQQK